MRGERIVLGAFDGARLVGAVTLLLDLAQNQPHRAEIAKLMTRISHRGRGVAKALLQRAESLAVERARTLLVLDTAADGGAAPLYERLGFRLAGVIPDYSLKPQGGLTDVMIYWKLAATARPGTPDRGATGSLVRDTPPQSRGNPPLSGWRRRPARR